MLAYYFFLSLLSASALAYDLANYPAPAAPASGNATLAQLLLQGQTIVKSAPRGESSPTNDWTLDITGCNSASHWAITYDDGPSAEFTPGVLAELARHDIKATFFVTGSNVVTYPQILIDTYKAGHTIGIHTWNHDYLSSLGDDLVIAEIVWTMRAVRELIGVTPTLLRPPFGDIDPRVRSIAKALGLHVIIWNRDTDDWKFLGTKSSGNSTVSSAVLQRFETWLAEPQKGTISLQHDIKPVPVSNIAPSLELLKGSSYQFVDVATCAGVQAYDDAVLTKAGLITPTANVIDPLARGSSTSTDTKATGSSNSSSVDPRDEAFAKRQRGSSARSTVSWLLSSFLLLFTWL